MEELMLLKKNVENILSLFATAKKALSLDLVCRLSFADCQDRCHKSAVVVITEITFGFALNFCNMYKR